MPLEVTIDHVRRVIMMRGSGVLTDSDLVQAHNQCENDLALDPSLPRICDLSEIDGVSISNESLEAWVADPISNPPVRHAIICTAPPVLKRVLDYMTLSRRKFREVSVFPSYDQALDWVMR